MKSNQIISPPSKLHDLGDGTSYFNYNIVESEIQGVLNYDYEQVIVKHPLSYDKVLVALIREKYSVNDELAILRQQSINSIKFDTYFDFVEECKSLVNEIADELPEQISVELNTVPKSITMRQTELALLNKGLLSAVRGVVSGMDEATQIEWSRATLVEYNNVLVSGVCQMLDIDKDEFFIYANTL